MIPFRGRALAGVGRLLRIYDLGKKKLLRKCENKVCSLLCRPSANTCVAELGQLAVRGAPRLQHLPYSIVGLQTMGQRIYVSDVQESVHFVRYKPLENQLIIFADDTDQKFVTCTCLLDYDTVAVADKFGNISVVRVCTRPLTKIRARLISYGDCPLFRFGFPKER